MTKPELSLALLAITCVLHAVPAQAQTRVFVAAQGADGNPCTFALPCRTFQHAHDVVATNGEIDVLDPAGYGSVTISKAISIQGHGYSGISAPGGVGIIINAGPSDLVHLRGLLIDGAGTGFNGVVFNSGASLAIADSVIRNFSGHGIYYTPGTTSELSVSQTFISHLGSGGTAVTIQPFGSAPVSAVLDHVRLDHGADGVFVFGNGTTGSVNVAIVDSVISNYGNHALEVMSTSGATMLLVQRCTVSNNSTGLILSGAFASARVTRSAITGNSTGWTALSGSLISYGDNVVDGNTTEGSSTSTTGYH